MARKAPQKSTMQRILILFFTLIFCCTIRQTDLALLTWSRLTQRVGRRCAAVQWEQAGYIVTNISLRFKTLVTFIFHSIILM
jgi:hypothetical protein